MIGDIIIGVLPFIVPYTILGENLGGIILAIAACIYLFFNKKKSKINRTFLYIIATLNIIAILSLVFVSLSFESFSGYIIYFNMIIYYLVYTRVNDENQGMNKYIVRINTVICMFYIIYQGLFLKVRMYGNIGYANTYALILLISIFLNKINKEEIYKNEIEMILIIGLLFTGSRTTLILLVLYYFIEVIRNIKDKKIEVVNLCEPLLWGFIQYFVYSKLNMASILVMPIIFLIYSMVVKLKKKHYIYIGILIVSIVILALGTSNTILRIRNISITNGSFQERLVYYEDSIKELGNNISGNGINSFQYKQYSEASAFYDVKYIHNSIIQVAYDIGIIGCLVFIALFSYGLRSIIKSKCEERKYLIYIYLYIFLHSLLDFDFSYSSISIIVMMIISIVDTKDKLEINLRKSIFIPIIILLLYPLCIESLLDIGKKQYINSNYENSISTYKIVDKLTFNKDYRSNFYIAQNYKGLYDENGDISKLEKVISYLELAKKNNKYDPRIDWNLSYCYIKLDDEVNVIKGMRTLLEKEKYNNEVYSLFEEYFIDKYNESNDDKYYSIVKDIKFKKEQAEKSLNKKSIYMKNQIKKD